MITVSGASSNNKDFTVEVITDANNIIVNQAHAGGTTTKSLINETVSATITLFGRAGFVEIGKGQGQIDLSASRAFNVTYTNITGRSLSLIVTVTGDFKGGGLVTVDDEVIARNKGGDYYSSTQSTDGYGPASIIVPSGSTYVLTKTGTATIAYWGELR